MIQAQMDIEHQQAQNLIQPILDIENGLLKVGYITSFQKQQFKIYMIKYFFPLYVKINRS